MNYKEGLKELNKGCNCLITGPAGTGKTSLLNEYADSQTKKGKKVLSTATTGFAAINVNGITAHKAFGIPIPAYGHTEKDIKKATIAAAMEADIIAIEEISMCRNDVFEFICMVLDYIKKSTKKKQQIILCGDFKQLSPVVKKNELKIFEKFGLDKSGYCFTSPEWSKLKLKIISLDEIMRQDNVEFIQNLGKMRDGDVSCIDYFNDFVREERNQNAITICPTNNQADAINEEIFQNIKEVPKLLCGKKTGIFDTESIVPCNLVLKMGCKVMTIVNSADNENKYENGTTGIITGFTQEEIKFHDGGSEFIDVVIIKTDKGDTVKVKPYTWKNYIYKTANGLLDKKEIGTYKQIPLKLAYAITIHKSQGQTYEYINISPESFTPWQLYVALSRARKPESITLLSEILPEYIKTDNIVTDFVNNEYHYEVPEKIIKKKASVKSRQTAKLAKNKKSKKTTKTKKPTTKKTTAVKSKKTPKKTTTKAKIPTRKGKSNANTKTGTGKLKVSKAVSSRKKM